jgi:hypothetical protein
MIVKKALGGVEVKDAEKGLVTAVFSTFNVVDADQDVTLPGAFDDGAEWMISAYGHKSWDGALPVGKGVVHATATEATLEGQFFLDTVGGLETFKVVKAMGSLQEWSYSCQPDKYSYGDFDGKSVRFLEHIMPGGEVSPVIKGAGVGTRTLAVKSGLTFAGEAEAVLADLVNLTDRAADVLAKRQQKGKGFGAESAALLEQIQTQVKRLDELLAAPEPESTTTPDGLTAEWLRHVARTRGFAINA